MEDPRVQEAIQRLQTGEASEEDARIAFESGYEGGPKTQEYYRELGLLNEQPAGTPPQDIPPAETPTPNAMAGDPRFQAPQQPVESPAAETEDKYPDFSKYKDTDVFDRGIKAWSPLAPSIIKGGDMSGEAAGYRAAAGIEDKAAADNAKILQWNKQRATDNALADKIAAAQASGQWRQNANALGAEGGASVVASQNQAVTPDIMAQKQYQSQQMNTATQNLAEVNTRKLAAQDDRINADRTNYNTQVNESQNAYKTNLATANDQSKKPETKEQPKQETEQPKQEAREPEKTEPKSTDTQPEQSQGPVAETNKQSEAIDNASQTMADKQAVDKLIDEVNQINSQQTDSYIGRDGKPTTKADHYALIEAEYNKIKERTPDIPTLPRLEVPVGNIATAINDMVN